MFSNPEKTSFFEEKDNQKKELLLEHLRSNIIGDFFFFRTPFGSKPLIYADYVASGRSVTFIEDYISNNVLPYYANTHTYTSYVGSNTGALREEARHLIKSQINGSNEDVLLFVGSGSTGAVNKLVTILKTSNWGARHSNYGQNSNNKITCLSCSHTFETDGTYLKHQEVAHPEAPLASPELPEKPVVFLSIYEHHSNILPWREADAEVIFINDDENGMLDLSQLKSELAKHKDRKMKIGSFSACSNVNGTLTDVKKVTNILKKNSALAFFDYAAGAPYLVIDMNPKGAAAIDGIFFSGHKLIGGPGTPGVLCVKRHLLGNAVPTQSGGGTVFFVTNESHIYLENPEEKEEAGTPEIVGSIRLGLVFELKSRIGASFIMKTELRHFKKMNKKLASIPNLVLLGNSNAVRLPIFSFLIKHEDKFLHYGFVSALLNDLFGIETRGGCACAGPYSLRLLGITNEKANLYKNARLEGYELFIPGFTRLSINYFFSKETIEYIYRAVEFIAKHGVWFLPFYKFDLRKKIAVHVKSKFDLKSNYSLKNLNLKNESLGAEHAQKKADPAQLREFIRIAYSTLDNVKSTYPYHELAKEFELSEEIEGLRWFMWPSEATSWVHANREVKASSRRYVKGHDKNASCEPIAVRLPAIKSGSSKNLAGTVSPKSMQISEKTIAQISRRRVIKDKY